MKLQQVGKMNKPLMFQSLGKYPEVQRPEKLIHTHSTRHAVVFAPTDKAKEFRHLPDQLSKITYSTDNDLKDLLEITKACFDREWFNVITSNPDVIQGVGDAPKCATSLSDFVMYGGNRNPYLSELKEPSFKTSKAIVREDAKANVNTDRRTSQVVSRNEPANGVSSVQLKSNKPPPIIPLIRPRILDGYDLTNDQDDDIGLVLPTGNMGFSSYADNMDDDQNINPEERLHGDAIDIIRRRMPKSNNVNQPESIVQREVPSQSIAMPRITYEETKEVIPRTLSSSISPPASSHIDAPPPPSIDVPVPPPFDAPIPPPFDGSIPHPMNTLEPPPIDMPIPPVIDAPVPPSIDAPIPPPIDIPKPQSNLEAPATTSDRGNLYIDYRQIPCVCKK